MNKRMFSVFGLCLWIFLFVTGCENKQSNIIEIEDDYVWESDEYTVECVPSPTGKGGDMCFVPEGEFKQGCNEAIDDECHILEYPYHRKTLESFWIDKYEVTIEEFQKCIDAGACNNNDKESPHYDAYRIIDEYEEYYNWCNLNNAEKSGHPMNCVSWLGAEAYCKWVGKRLPTEAEWEKAARGTDGRKYPWGNDEISCEHAVYNETDSLYNGETQPIGIREKGVSPYGCYDMAGNISEWTSDKFDYYRPDEDDIIYDYPSLKTLSHITTRGGYYRGGKRHVRCSNRGVVASVEELNDTMGIRCVK